MNPINVEDNAPIRRQHGIPDKLSGCHTGVVAGYAIEGHVPAREIKRLLAEKPGGKGLAVPGMPAGSPGMPSDKPQPYAVLLIRNDGTTSVFQHYPEPSR